VARLKEGDDARVHAPRGPVRILPVLVDVAVHGGAEPVVGEPTGRPVMSMWIAGARRQFDAAQAGGAPTLIEQVVPAKGCHEPEDPLKDRLERSQDAHPLDKPGAGDPRGEGRDHLQWAQVYGL
jgi:hypothetical protein